MGPVLSSLVNLQRIELELRQANKQLRRNQQVVSRQQQMIDQLKATQQAKLEEIKLTRLQYSRLELELKTRDDEITKYRVALNSAKTNKEYSAILTRINTDKADNSKLEDQILSLMGQIDRDQGICREVERSIEEETQKMNQLHEDAGQKHKVIQAEVDRLTELYDQASSQVSVKELNLFLRLAERFSGEVLAEVNQPQSRRSDRTCGGCFMTVPLETANALMSKDEVITCPSCGRILVLDKTTQQQPI